MLSETERLAEDGVPWSPWAAVGLWAAGFFGSAVWVSFLLTLVGSNDDLTGSVPWLFVGQIALWVAYGLGPLILARQHGVRYESAFNLSFRGRDVAIWGFAGLLVQLVVIPLVYVPLRSIIDSEEVGEQAEQLIETAGNPVDVVLLFIMIVLIAPVVEELFFRGTALPAIMTRLGAPAAVLISSVWFAASHLQLVQFPGLLAVGLVLGVCRVYTRSLVPAIALHMAFNGVTFGVLVSQLEF
ncbi:MAG: CPBP family intramembrane glutamic endopeptidase [Acidimicrobiia bacterium]